MIVIISIKIQNITKDLNAQYAHLRDGLEMRHVFLFNSMNLFAYLNQLLLFIHLLQIIKQCQIILNFLAAEGALTPLHLESIWAAAKLKHSGRYVHDLFPHLIKHLEPELLFHLLKLVSRLHPSEHTEQVS